MEISFHCEEGVSFPSFFSEQNTNSWIDQTITNEQKLTGVLSFVFCDDNYLLSINQKYLNHDTFTDIITFDYCEGNSISGDLFISLERVEENANEHSTTFHNELNRVVIHGVLHLCGYKDKTDEEAKTMRRKEDYYLNRIF